ncbi:MAG: C4-dicarboxylate ABC transporter permease [Hyphomicrobiales bacterium]|nr:TRAP transporter small permease subunit [Hyphomicrobiales bacterium]PCJ90931.1 MAG: C4-dicarboxylate ABC transporter permease [Hyphomicrobiales bacterium]
MYQRLEFACASLLLAAIVILVGIASVARAVGSPIIWSVEIAQLLFVWLCMVSADLALQHNRHFGLSILLDNINPKIRKIMELLNLVILIFFLIFLLFYAWKNTVLMHPRLIGATQMHGSYIHASMLVGLAMLLRTMIVQFIERIKSKGTI